MRSNHLGWKIVKGALAALAVAIFWNPAHAVTYAVNCASASLQARLDNTDLLGQLQPGDFINVSGTCNENLVIRNERIRLTVTGTGVSPTLNGPSAAAPTLNVRGKGILIQNFTITGGSRGVHVNRNSNALIFNNVIQTTGGDGVLIDEQAFAVLKNNTIQNNPGNGVRISEASTARIGFEFPEDLIAGPNTITDNAGRGILVERNSAARIVSNTISNNGADGIWVTGSSQADISSNTINSNGNVGTGLGSGVWVNNDSNVILGHGTTTIGEDTTIGLANFLRDPNITTVNNVEFGVKCTVRTGTIDGQRGATQLNGNLGQIGFDPACHVQYQ